MANSTRLYLLGLKGLRIVQNLGENDLSIIKDIVIGHDKAILDDYSLEIELECKKKFIPYYLRNTEPVTSGDYFIAVGWRWLIDFNDNKLIVIHDSLLPKLRGFNPLVTALINGDEKIGATAILANSDFDKGPIIYQKYVEVNYPIKIKYAIELISILYCDIIKFLLSKLKEGNLIFQEQNDLIATYSLWRDEDDYFINWAWDAEKIKRFIDAVGYPYKGAKTILNNTELRVYDAIVLDDLVIENRTPGKVLFKDYEGLTITCGKGLLKIKDFYKSENFKFDYSNKFRLRFK